MKLKVCLILSLSLKLALAEDSGLCGLGPPKDGESCGGESEENGVEQEDPELWDKRNYAKIGHTSKYDWPIRARIDAVEEILSESSTPVEDVTALLKEYPDSPRLLLLKGLALEMKLYKKELEEPTFTAEKARRQALVKKVIGSAAEVVDLFEDLPLDYVEEHQDEEFFSMDYKVPPFVFRSAINMAVRAAEGADLLSEAIPLIEKALEKDEALKADAQKLHAMMANHYMVTRQVDKLLAMAQDGKATWPDNKQWAFTEGVALKMAGKKKEANTILRDIDVEGNSAEFVLEISELGMAMEGKGRLEDARLLYQEASKLHLFPSKFQRPALALQDLESKPVWDAKDLANHTEAFIELEASVKAIAAEAEVIMANMTGENNWLVAKKGYSQSNVVLSEDAAIHVYPLYLYSKKKMAACSDMSNACQVLNKHLKSVINCKVCTTKVVVLDPGFRTAHYTSPVNSRLRALLPLKNVEGLKLTIGGLDEVVALADNQVTVVDESFEHVWENPTGQPSAFLAVDFNHPNIAKDENSHTLTKNGENFYAVW